MKTIFSVDRDGSYRDLLQTAFEDAGYLFRGFSDPLVALKAVRQNPPDLITTALHFTDMIGGFDFLRMIRKKSGTPVVLITGASHGEIHFRSGRWMPNEIFQKSFRLSKLIQRIGELIVDRQSGLHTALEAAQKDPLLVGDLKLEPENGYCYWKWNPIDLTMAEFRMLQALALKPGSLKGREALKDIGLGDMAFVDPDELVYGMMTEMIHKFRKIDPDFEAIEHYYQVGYRLRVGHQTEV